MACEVWEAGDEIVINLSQEAVYRTSVASPNRRDQFDATIRRRLLDRLHKATLRNQLERLGMICPASQKRGSNRSDPATSPAVYFFFLVALDIL